MQHFARTALYMSVASVLACIPSADADSALPKLGTVTVGERRKNALERPANGHALSIPGGAKQTNPYACRHLPPAVGHGPESRSLRPDQRARQQQGYPHHGRAQTPRRVNTVKGLPLFAINRPESSFFSTWESS